MKRWLLVVSPALAIAILGTGFVLVTDRDPDPLAPRTPGVSPSPSPSTIIGSTGSTGQAGAPSGEIGGPEETMATPTFGAPATPPPGVGNDQGEPAGTDEPTDPAKTQTVSLILLQATMPTQTVDVQAGAAVVLQVLSVDVEDTLHVRGFDVRRDVRPGIPTTIELEADELGSFAVFLEDSGVLVAQLNVQP